MFLTLLKRDFKRNYLMILLLFIFIMLSAVLISSGSIMVNEIFSSMDHFFNTAKTPHFVQMHAGAIDEYAIDEFAQSNDVVEAYQVSRMITIDNQTIDWHKDHAPQSSVMDNSFVTQNETFDYLLTLNNEVVQVNPGEIAVPLYYRSKYDLAIGDELSLRSSTYHKTFTIKHFVRDAQMNASIISSKRFVIHASDYEALAEMNPEYEYLIEFLLTDLDQIENFKKDYRNAGLPDKGPTIDYTLFRLMNALSDGMIAVIIIFVSLLLIIIAILCIRFSIITTTEEDIKEIGAMKAIGLPYYSIKKLYLTKYIVIALSATLVGYLCSLKFSYLLTSNISLYMGQVNRGFETYLMAFLSVLLMLFVILFFCILILKKFKHVSPVEVLNEGQLSTATHQKSTLTNYLTLEKLKKFPIHWNLSFKDILLRRRMYLLVFLIITICIYIMIVPFNFLTTLNSPEFISYMGVAKSDIRIDMMQKENSLETYELILEDLKNDEDIAKVNGFVTSQYDVLNSDGYYESMTIETGNFGAYDLKYLEGSAPEDGHEIALSTLNAEAFDKTIGDQLTLLINNQETNLTIAGIYQDITNGGKTAKANIPYDPESLIWSTINLTLKGNRSIDNKIEIIKNKYSNVKVTGIEEYLDQTLSGTIEQVQLITYIAMVIGFILIVLIISLFTKMILIKDHYDIAILKSIGVSEMNITQQYIFRLINISLLAIIFSTVLANTTGEYIVSLLMSFLGASNIVFVINPWVVYLVIPLTALLLIIMSIKGVTTAISQIKVNNVFNN